MRVARVNVDKNIDILNNLMATNATLSKTEKKSIEGRQEVAANRKEAATCDA